MTVAIYPGSFDPITNGHVDILKRGAEIFDKIIVAVAYNPNKLGFLPIEVRLELVKKCISDIPNAEADCFEGLTVEYAKKRGTEVLLRGLRTSADFEYELQLSQINRTLDSSIKTVFLIAKPEYGFISSTSVRELLINKGDISKFVPQEAAEYLSGIYGA